MGMPRPSGQSRRDYRTGPASGRLQDVFPYARAALGKPGALALMALLNSKSHLSGSLPGYPYRYRPLDTVLGQAPPARFASGATSLGAALTVLAAQPHSDPPRLAEMAIINAAPAAYGVLNRARAAGGCAPQLDLLLLLIADNSTSAGVFSQEEQRTETACPHDPTPGWLVGQSQLDISDSESSTATFSRLDTRHPRDAAVLTGLGDSYLLAGTSLLSSAPFTARQDFRLAITEYKRASALGDEHDAVPGVARVLIGLGKPAQAARLLSPLARASGSPGQLLQLLITADEAAHDFGAAAAATQRLGHLGSASWPDGNALIPASPDESFLPSWGIGRLTPLTAEVSPRDLSGGGQGGATTTEDRSFIPDYRDGYRDDHGVTGTNPGCPSWTWARDELLLGHAAVALANWPERFRSIRPGGSCAQGDELKLMAETEAGRRLDQDIVKRDDITSDDIADAWQNLLRWADDFPAAKKSAEQWQEARGDNTARPALDLGEIDFLKSHYNDAAAEFGLAARRWRLVRDDDDLAVGQAELDRGAALLAAGRTAEAVQVLRPLDMAGIRSYAHGSPQGGTDPDTAFQFAEVSYYACEQLGDFETESGNLHAAAEDYANALDWLPQLGEGSGLRPEVLYNNAALAYLGLGDTRTAAALASKALQVDPENPAFLMTAGYIADRAGRVVQAARYDREALSSDPGAYPAANDLGVELTRDHRDSVAAEALRRAVRASAGYALGWFNLGVVESKLGPSRLPAAQGAFAIAYSLNPALKDRRPDMTIDAKVYRTALDLSKPLPPSWSISQLQRPVPAAAAGLLALVMLGLGLARATGHGGSAIAAQWLDQLSGRLQSVPLLRKLQHPGWSLAVTAASFLFAYLRRGAGQTEVVAYTAGVVILAFLAVGARVLLARRRHIAITHESWPPAMAFSLVTGAIGLPWASLPVVRADGGNGAKAVHLAAPITLAALSAMLFVESVWLHTPLTGSWAVAALIMSASTLLPVGPLDGAQLGKAGILAATGVVGGALLVGLSLI